MSIITIASSNSCFRGLNYYNGKRIKNIKKISDNEYTSVVKGGKDYNVYLNLEHPRKSTCDCPLANGKHIICKHIVATYFTVVPRSAENFKKEQDELQEEYEECEERKYTNVVKYIQAMSKEELVRELLHTFDYAPEWIYDDFARRHDIEG